MSTELTEPIVKKNGRPFSEVWDGHMIKGAQVSRGHYAAVCSYCNCVWKPGKPHSLREHLANTCKKCPQEVSLYFAKIVGKQMGEADYIESASDSEEPPNKKQKYEQTSIRNFYKNKKLEKGYADDIDRSVTKAFVMSNIPFSIVENPWFVDMIKTLQPGYDPPTRQTLSGTLLQAEVSRVNLRIFNELNKVTNCTIGKFFNCFNFSFNFFSI
jgi:hypothetical protein